FFTVITSLGLGFSPIAWGLIIDAIGEWQRATGPLLWNRYTVFYFAVLALLVVVISASFVLPEKAAPRPLDSRDTVFRANLKRLLQLWQR
ncbi:MAG: hypothetical protein QOD99_268, partial [Chthoniobacter sp.]|nr:hypothetical protein [Chthoniobacter sp.]